MALVVLLAGVRIKFGRSAIEPVPALRYFINSLCDWNSIYGIQSDRTEFSSLDEHSTCALTPIDAESVCYMLYMNEEKEAPRMCVCVFEWIREKSKSNGVKMLLLKRKLVPALFPRSPFP